MGKRTGRVEINAVVSLRHARDLYANRGRVQGMYRRIGQVGEQYCHLCTTDFCQRMRLTPREISEMFVFTLVKSQIGVRCDKCNRRVSIKSTRSGKKKMGWGRKQEAEEAFELARVNIDRRKRGLPELKTLRQISR